MFLVLIKVMVSKQPEHIQELLRCFFPKAPQNHLDELIKELRAPSAR